MSQFASYLLSEEDTSRVRKNLFVVQTLNFNEPETPNVLFENVKRECDDTMRIYLRLRPITDSQKAQCYDTIDENEVIAIPPEDSASYRNFVQGYGKTSQKFSFSKLFHGSSDQDTVFEETTGPLLESFLKGNDRLLFTYGTTSGGKTFTMNGNKSNVGIIPRSLSALFQNTRLSNDISTMPIDFSETIVLSQADIQRITKDKAVLLKLSEKESSDVLHSLSQNDVNDNPSDEYSTTFWVTFTEIYNDVIHDLLDPVQCASIKAPKRPMLDIRTARNGGSYVKGLSCYPVFTAEEAYRLLLVGRRSQRMGSTKLNQNSSRSHTIFTIRAVRSTPSSRYLTRVSNLSFCDLAGSERTTKAGTVGVSQKEANNINSSLLALGRCIEVLRRNQTNPNNMSVVPFRDSKLTRLFQTYLTGNGTAAMIVCVNQDPVLFDETIQVLKFSALARTVVLHEKEKEKKEVPIPLRQSHFRRLGLNTPRRDTNGLAWDSDDDTVIEGDEEEELSDGEEDQFTTEKLIETIELLKGELLATKMEKIANGARITDRLNNEWSKRILEMENEHSERLQEMRDQMNTCMLKKVKSERNNAYVQLKKRKLQNEDSDNNADILEAKERAIAKLETDMKEAQEESAEARETAEILAQELGKLRIECKQHEFRATMLQTELRAAARTERRDACVQTEKESRLSSRDMPDWSIVTVDAERSDRSISSTGSRFNRFSSLTSDPSLRTPKSLETYVPAGGYFGKVGLSAEKEEPVIARGQEWKQQQKKVHMFEIHEEDVNDDDDDGDEESSFLRHEQLAQVCHLESRIEEQGNELEMKSVTIKELREQLEAERRQVVTSTAKLIDREKAMIGLGQQQRAVLGSVNTMIAELGLQSQDSDDVSHKLQLLSAVVKRYRPRLRSADSEDGENEQPS